MIEGIIRSIAIIGGGVAGVAAARTMIGEGIECVIFERADRVGGVWADGYLNFGVQVQKELYEFPDFPLPSEAPNFTPGPAMQAYIANYCDRFGVTPALRLSTRVLAVEARPDGAPGWQIRSETGGETRTESFDMVIVATGLYSETPHIPDIPGREMYRGQVMHVSELKTVDPLQDRKIAVIGYGKSATDAATEGAKAGREAHLVFRDAHWPVPRKLAGVLPFKWGMLNRLTAALIPPYVRPSAVQRAAHSVGYPLVWVFWRAVELLLRVQFRLDTRIANGKTLLPEHRVEIDCFGESTMVPRPGFMTHIRSGRLTAHRTEVARFTDSGIVLADGTTLDVDCVLFGTGWKTDYGYLADPIRHVLGDEADGFYLYRHMLHPDLPNLAFAGRASTFLSVVTYSIQARWLAEVVHGHVALPGRPAMREEIDALKRWKRTWMPFSPIRSARVLLHMANYHDELLTDFGADPFRKKGSLAPLKELFAPYQSCDYREIVSGDWTQRPGARRSAGTPIVTP